MSSQRGDGQAPRIDELRRRFLKARGREAWRLIEELGASDGVVQRLLQEFPSQAARLQSGVDRRDFFRLMGASMAMAGLGACTRQPNEVILPYARSPEQTVPGVPLHFATAMAVGGAGLGLLVESHEGRPTKVEGNPDHPSSLGATDVTAQASVLSLYDPERSRVVLRGGRIDTWTSFVEVVRAELEGPRARGGRGLRLLTGTVLSPTLHAQIEALLGELPEARWHRYDPVHRDLPRAGALLAFGRDVEVRPHFDRAGLVVSLDADFLGAEPGAVRHARDFVDRRRGEVSNRLFAVESAPGLTGAFADHLLAVPPSRVELVARALGARVGLDVAAPDSLGEAERRFIDVLAGELEANRGASLITAGRWASPATHALVHALNGRLENAGRTVEYTEPVELGATDHGASLEELVAGMRSGDVTHLFMLGGNPVYDAPGDLAFAEALMGVPFRAHLSPYEDETSRLCHWHVPESHFLESWSDLRGHDGTVSIVQPLIAPLFDTRGSHQFLALLQGRPGVSDHDLVREHWSERHDGGDFEPFWKTALHDGVLPDTALQPVGASVRGALPDELGPPAPAATAGALELALRPDASVWDGRWASNGWLQELPRPLSRLTWDNAALMGSETARRLGVESGDVLTLTVEGREVRAPVWVHAGHPEGSLTAHLGYGRTQAGPVGSGVGFDAYRLRSSGSPWQRVDLAWSRAEGRHEFASVQDHRDLEGRDLLRVATRDRFARDPHLWDAGGHGGDEHASLLHERDDGGRYAWGMAIDLGSCIGCNACTIACQAENNIPVVGKDEVANGREMHWIRVDVYETGDEDAPERHHQPVPCMHCEAAPCEVVCPVAATVHSPEGLNEMVYNRCVGTRYCSNNCPYKVRRFNFYPYADYSDEVRALGRNPDVTVRTRGIMEKCTYCVQRINHARIQAKLEDRPIADGEVVTACQQVCPTRAITFGDIDDPGSAVSAARRDPRHYGLLAELGTRPRTTYLAKLTNPNPELAG